MIRKHDIEDHREDQFAEYQKSLSAPETEEEEFAPVDLSKFDHLLEALEECDKPEPTPDPVRTSPVHPTIERALMPFFPSIGMSVVDDQPVSRFRAECSMFGFIGDDGDGFECFGDAMNSMSRWISGPEVDDTMLKDPRFYVSIGIDNGTTWKTVFKITGKQILQFKKFGLKF